jgi:nucleotide-binding universal stress UspA family protein
MVSIQKKMRVGAAKVQWLKSGLEMEAKMYKKILVPLDGSELAECALAHVKKLFQDGHVEEVTLLNAVDTQIPWREFSPGEELHPVAFDYNGFVKTYMDKSRKYLAKAQSRLSAEGINVQTESIESNGPSHTITDYAQKSGADLIIMATHGYTGMKKMMLGSTALKVLHESNVPVLLIRPDACRV